MLNDLKNKLCTHTHTHTHPHTHSYLILHLLSHSHTITFVHGSITSHTPTLPHLTLPHSHIHGSIPRYIHTDTLHWAISLARPRCPGRPHLSGRHGLRYGVLLSSGARGLRTEPHVDAWVLPDVWPLCLSDMHALSVLSSALCFSLINHFLSLYLCTCSHAFWLSQVTFQACSLAEARYLYDQLAVIAPVMLALSGISISKLPLSYFYLSFL